MDLSLGNWGCGDKKSPLNTVNIFLVIVFLVMGIKRSETKELNTESDLSLKFPVFLVHVIPKYMKRNVIINETADDTGIKNIDSGNNKREKKKVRGR